MRRPDVWTARWPMMLVAVLALSWAFAPGAVAGGPTSVLVVSPESEETAALYFSGADYPKLLEQLAGPGALVGDPALKGQRERPFSIGGRAAERQIDVTWMVHDMTPWRVDQVYVTPGDPTVWIFSATELSSARAGVWHKADHPARLQGLLTEIGVMGKETPDGAPGVPFSSSSWGRAARPEAPAPGTDGGWGPWWWAIPGGAAGVVLGLLLRRQLPRLPRPPFGRRGEPQENGPRQQLLEL